MMSFAATCVRRLVRYVSGRDRRWYIHRGIASALIVLVLAIGLRHFMRRVPLRAWQHEILSAESPILVRHLAQHTTLDEHERVDGILVLGYSVNHGQEYPTDPLIQRLETAYQLACVHDPPLSDTIIVTGGSDWRVPRHWATEADVMAKWLRQRASNDSQSKCSPTTTTITPVDSYGGDGDDSQQRQSQPQRPLRIILERESTSTRLNAANAMTLLYARYPSIRRLILVTNRFHQWRALRVFQQVARELFPLAPTATAAADKNNHTGNSESISMWVSGTNTNDSWFSFVMAPMKLDSAVPQWDFWRELLAMGLYRVMRWV